MWMEDAEAVAAEMHVRLALPSLPGLFGTACNLIPAVCIGRGGIGR